VIDHVDDAIGQGKAIREEQDGLRLFLDLQKVDKAKAVEALESVLSRLRN
jgi:hypothetical protein